MFNQRCKSSQYFIKTCTPCTSGLYAFGKCFQISNDTLDYDSARLKCISLNGTLALTNSDEKFSFISSLYNVVASTFFVGAHALAAKIFRNLDGSASVYK